MELSIHRAWALVLLGVLACAPKPSPVTGKEWKVVAIGKLMSPVGAGGRPLTMTFDDSTQRVYGFGGCNRYNAGYTLSADSLLFGPVISTRMACEGFDSLESAFLQTLPRMQHVTLSDSLLILSGEGTAIRLR
jgi:heat shock protein HslJ